MGQSKYQHREFVQSAITRMSTNSFQIKGLTITIVSAFLGIYASNKINIFLIIPIPITFLFWLLDSYYLQLERKFRGIYNDICGITPLNERITNQTYLMNISLYQEGEYNFFNVLMSPTICSMYLVIETMLIGVFFYLECSC